MESSPTIGGFCFLGGRQTRAGQIEVVGDVGNDLRDVESHRLFANPAAGELVAANGQDFMLLPVALVNHGVQAGDGDHLSRRKRSDFANC